MSLYRPRDKFSTNHTFDAPVAFQIATLLPSGDGIAQPRFILVSCSMGVALPDKSTFSRVQEPAGLKPVVHRFPVPELEKAVIQKPSPSAFQSSVIMPAQSFSGTTR